MQAGMESGAMHKVFERYPFQDLKADLCQLALRVEAKLPPPVLHKVTAHRHFDDVCEHRRHADDCARCLLLVAA